MKLATPRGWYQREGLGFRGGQMVLTPLSWAWSAATAHRLAATTPHAAGAPVICVGNLTLGGSGKTPIAREVTRLLTAAGERPHLLLRGHGGRLSGPQRVDLGRHTAAQVGDEALMLSADAPVWIARDRLAGARAAAKTASVVVMDDGFQNPHVLKDLCLVVVDGETRDGEWPFGDGKVFPAGPLREPIRAGLARADAVIVLLPDDLAEPDPSLLKLLAGPPIHIAHLRPVAPPPVGRLLAFAGIAKPWKVERALRAAGADLADFAPLPDHAPLSEALLEALAARARALGAALLTTEKDAARLQGPWRDRVAVWRVTARFDDEAATLTLAQSVLHAHVGD